MANNLAIKDGNAAAQTVKTTDSGGVHTPHYNIDSVTPGTAAANLGKAEDAAHASGDTGVMALAVRRDTPAALAADGDYLPVIVDAEGRLWARATAAGDVAHDAADSGNPMKVGGKAETTLPAAVADGDRVDAFFTEYGELAVVAGGRTVCAEAAFTRPADTTAYAAGDVVADLTASANDLEFTAIVRKPGGSGVILSAVLIDGANQGTKGDFELFLFDTAMAMDNDNALFTPTDAELEKLVGVIDFGATPFVGDATSGADGNCAYVQAGVNLAFKCAGSDTKLYGVLVVRNAYTPVSAEPFRVRLNVLQD